MGESVTGAARAAGAGLLVGLMLAASGCDRMPWAPKDEDASAGSLSATPADTRIVPTHKLIATANGTQLSTADVELAVQELRQFIEAYQQEWQPLSATSSPDEMDLHDVMDNLIDTEVKAQDARARGLDRKTEVQERFAYLQRGFYAAEWENAQREQAAPTEDEVHAFYEQNKAAFVDPERIRVRQVVLPTLAEAESVRTQAIGGADFAQLARSLSVGPKKGEGGDIGWHLRALDKERLAQLGLAPTEEVFFPQLEPLAFALTVNQVSQPVKGPDNRFYVVKLEERKAATQQTELEMYDGIKELLTLQAMQEKLDELRGKAAIERYPERLEVVTQ